VGSTFAGLAFCATLVLTKIDNNNIIIITFIGNIQGLTFTWTEKVVEEFLPHL